jgi:hypothetical protein
LKPSESSLADVVAALESEALESEDEEPESPVSMKELSESVAESPFLLSVM